jgi:putative ABC transport system ATP-binding protein
MQQQDDIILAIRHLSRTVNGYTLIDDITVAIRRGEVVAIVGPSGSGKTSLLRLLNRLDEPTAGTVLLDGQDYTTIPPTTLRQRIGMVLQSPFLFEGTVADNIQYGPQQRGETLSPETIEHWLEQSGLPGYTSRDVSNLSGGEAQRVSLIRTLANNPQVLLLDEPTSALDEVSVRSIETIITTMVQQQHITCLMITHSQEQAARIAHRVILIERGKLAAFGPVEEVLHAQSMVR